MASVYEATDLRLNRSVALKVLAEELAEGSDFRERFLRESRFAASLDHPNIVPIYEAGEADGRLYIAMRYVRGNNLAGVLRKDGPFEPRRALAILSPVADALDAAHNAGLVHRDVKPANILLTAAAGRDGYEHVYLTDFGLTKATSALTKLTATGNFIGTMAYVSPEQIRGEPLDARTDLYAFGCVAYECLTGVPPFVRDDQAALLWAHLNEPPAAVSDHRGDLLPADSVMAKALAKNPSDRYQTCDEFTQALSDMLLTGRHSPSSVLTTATPQPDRVSATETLAPGSASAVEASLPDDAQPATAGRGQGPDEPPRRTEPPDDEEPVAAGQGARQQKLPKVRRSQGGPQRPPTAGPPAVAARSRRRGRSRRPRRRAGLTVLAAVAGVAAILTAVLVVRPTTQVGVGKPTEAPSSAAAPSSATAASTQASASTDSAAPSSTEPPPVPAAPAVVPVASVAIPTIDGAPIPVGEMPGFVAISPDGRLAYIANRAAGVVTVLDITINKVTATIPVPAGPPQFIALTPDGSHAYVSIYNTDETINLVAVIDTKSTRLLGTIPVDKKPYALAVTPDQRFVYVPSHDAAHLDIIDIATNTVVQTVPVPPNPHWVTFTPDGKVAYVADHESNVLSVLDTASNTVVQTINVGTSPHSVAVSPDGKQVAVVCFDSNDLYFIDTATNQVVGRVPVGTNPQDVTYAPDGRYLYTANVDAGTVSVVDTQTRTVTANIPTDSPTSIAVLPNGRKAYVTNLNSNTLTVLNTGG